MAEDVKNMELDPRLFKGDAKIAAQHFVDKWPRDLLLWALDVRVGEYMATCEGCNRKIASKELIYVDADQYGDEDWEQDDDTQILHEVTFIDSRERYHTCPGGGCAYPKETPEQVTPYFKDWAFNEEVETGIRRWYGKETEKLEKVIADRDRMQAAFNAGRSIVDEHGELLEEFDVKRY